MSEEYRQYLIMRSDLDSLNPGKACAQAAHATDLMAHEMDHYYEHNIPETLFRAYEDAKRELGFMTTITLDGGNWANIDNFLATFDFGNKDTSHVVRVFDPTYPIRDGRVTHLIPIYTCAMVFCSSSVMHRSNYLKLYK